MTHNEPQFIKWLSETGRQQDTAASYASYLDSVSNHLQISITPDLVRKQANFDELISRWNQVDLGESYLSNCRTGLRAYRKFCEAVNSENHLPDEILPSQNATEGAKSKITVNRYERSTKARNRCIEAHGVSCAVCSFNFEKEYGLIGKGYIHVHHIVPLSEIAESYEVDPVNDLIPVCPNCHAMLHQATETMSLDDLKLSISKAKG